MERGGSPLLTDLYQLTMLQAYLDCGMTDVAVFEFFVRKLPSTWNFLVAAGLDDVLSYLEDLQFTAPELEWLSAQEFSSGTIDYLRQFRFSGDVDALLEGTIFFPTEPVLRVVAPLPQAQLVESRIINLLQFETLIASKAVRSVLVAPDKLLVEFGMRRAHGAEAALLAARASYLAGFSGTSNVLASMRYRIPAYGTMAHSFIQAHASESEAFLDFARSHRRNVVLLIDTYDTEQGAQRVIDVARTLAGEGIKVHGVRLDSGDLAEHACKVRAILDAGGLKEVTIFASGNLDEWKLRDLRDKGAPIDGFGIGSRLDVSADAPYLDCAYKLQEYAGVPRRKRSEGKATWPGRKQVFRHFDGLRMNYDTIATHNDSQSGVPLLRAAMKNGRRVAAKEPLTKTRKRVGAELAQLPERLHRLERSDPYRVEIAESLHQLARVADEAVSR
jgi:nicotinate phosphoribosyltransferase